MRAAYVLEALQDSALREQASLGLREGRAQVERLVRQALAQGQIAADRDPDVETDLLLSPTGLGPLLELEVIAQRAALDAIDQHLDRLFVVP